MDNTGEDSGLDFEDNSNTLAEENSLQQAENVDEVDEGISVANVSAQNVAPPCFPPIGFPGNAGIPQEFLLQQQQQQQQQEALNLQGFFVENSNSNSNSAFFEQQNQSEENSADGVDVRRDEVPPVGDDNNNDRPDDLNNNTTDPVMQQIQQEQIQQRQQQQQEEAEQQQRQQQEEQEQHQFQQVQLVVGGDEVTNEQKIITNGDAERKGKDKRKKKRKKKKNRLVVDAEGRFTKQTSNADKDEDEGDENEGEQNENNTPEDDVEVEYVPEKLELSVFDPMYRAFANVFENFRISEPKKKDEEKKPEEAPTTALKKVPKIDLEEDNEDMKKDDEKPKLSKRKLKKLTRLSIAELKQVVPRPDVVEMHDVTARDPKLLVHLKSYRNTVPVPRHWCYKRKYLQGKRGIEKAPFDLPAFIKKTGIMEMRAALAEKEETKTLKAKIRERVRPKMGKIDIDYQKLHDAFFKWQSKPKMTIHGDLYYEGKEFETRMKDKKPGELSDDLRTALGMPVGPNAHKVPPPWLIAMQRYGPPPSYPHLKIPGLNAPIPEGCSFGYHAGGWGKPPVDEFGRPLYGDVFGITGDGTGGGLEDEVVDRTLWGELESEEEAESEEEEEEEEEEKEEAENVEESGLQTPAEGLQTPSGFSSVPAGLETPDMIELRKKRIEQDMEGNDTPALYTVLPEKRVDRISGAMMASTHVYDLTAVREKPRGSGAEQGRVELTLDPSELDLVDNEGTLASRYEQQLKEQQSHLQKEDLSDMVAEHAAKQKSKRKRQMQQQDVKQAKKYKEFKF